jgi:ABC-2 type transport system ATP-binding protein
MPSDARVLLGAGRRGTGQGLKIKGFMPAVSFQAVSKTFVTPKGPFQALNQVNLDIEEGEFFGLLGPNGAGKTTLISILAGLARATSGRVLVQGSDVQTTLPRPGASWAWCRKSWCSIRFSTCARRCAFSRAISA